jgi:hypothetical protein
MGLNSNVVKSMDVQKGCLDKTRRDVLGDDKKLLPVECTNLFTTMNAMVDTRTTRAPDRIFQEKEVQALLQLVQVGNDFEHSDEEPIPLYSPREKCASNKEGEDQINLGPTGSLHNENHYMSRYHVAQKIVFDTSIDILR